LESFHIATDVENAVHFKANIEVLLTS